MNNLTEKEWNFLGEEAMKKQMLSKKDQEKQQRTIDKIEAEITKALTTR